MMSELGWLANGLLILDWTLRVGLSIRIIMRRRPVGVSLSWLVLILLLPFVGACVYLLVGENRLGAKRARRAAQLHDPYLAWLQQLAPASPVDWSGISDTCRALHQHALNTLGIPALPGNQLELLTDCQTALRAILAEIETARHSCHMEFYIWEEAGVADEVAEALIRAAQRGVICRILVDAVGSSHFLRGQTVKRMRAAGVAVVAALQVGGFRALFVRLDLRLHRKIVVIDGRVAYTGSLNMADARYFRRKAGIGPWVDAMVCIQGPAVEALNVTFLADWELEVDGRLEHLSQTGDLCPQAVHGKSVVQVVPSGPGYAPLAIHQMLLTTIYAARRELLMTTPYFVPDESILTALVSAAHRGVAVTIVVPSRVDQPLVHWASRSHFDDLLSAGVRICRFTGGLLHSKTITVDAETALIGSVNLDMRSFWLNFEVTLFVYDRNFCTEIRQMQLAYLHQAEELMLEVWRRRPVTVRFIENTAQLFGPVL